MQGKFGLAALAAAVVGAAAIGLWLWNAEDTAAPVRISVVQADLERGLRLYTRYCASCHGVNLEGDENWQQLGPDGVLRAPPHDETGHTWHHDDGLLFRYTKLGGAALMAERNVTGPRSGMPGFGDRLSDTEIKDILAYIKSRWPEKVRARQAAATERANRLR